MIDYNDVHFSLNTGDYRQPHGHFCNADAFKNAVTTDVVTFPRRGNSPRGGEVFDRVKNMIVDY